MDVELTPLDESHLAFMTAIVDDPDSIRFTRVPDPPEPDFITTWYARYAAGRVDGTREAFATVGGDGAFLGIAVAPSIDRDARTAELGYVIHPSARGQGVATASLRLLTDWALADLRLHRLELLISVDNPASKRVATKNGYSYEGTLRSAFVKPGHWEDTEVWSRLDTDPAPI